MRWCSYWRGSQNKQIKRIIKEFPKDSINFYFINFDLIIEDSLEIYKPYFEEFNNSIK